MRLKSYFVHTMEEALQVAKVELGDDAMLVDSKRLETPPGGRSRLEVIFAAPVAPPPPPKVTPLSAAMVVSGELSMVEAAAQLGYLDRKRTIIETLTSMRRAGADLILTYWATEVAGWL